MKRYDYNTISNHSLLYSLVSPMDEPTVVMVLVHWSGSCSGVVSGLRFLNMVSPVRYFQLVYTTH